ncbi:MAG: ABC transporter ATP-binding protein [Bradymonadia bacterium]
MASVKLEGVYKRYGDNEVVTDANLEIEDGDFLVLVGPSGCGKSTTLRMIAGLEEISAGTLKIDERVVNDLSPRDRDVAMVFQSYALYPHMSVRDNISFGLRLRKMPKPEIDKRVTDAAQILGLTELLDRKPKAMSGGQRQRVAMGRAIVRQPKVFLFDEPLSNLDAKLRVQMRTEIAKLHRRLGTTTVYVTHDQVEAMTLAKHIVVMNLGVIQQVGAPLELYREPANTFVAGFIGSPSMNFLDVELTTVGGAPHVKGAHINLPVPDRFKPFLEGAGKQLKLGIRPEHLVETEGAGDLPMQVDVIEPLGAEVYVIGTSGETPFTARLESDTQVQVGQQIGLKVDLDHMHLFEADTGRALGKPDAPIVVVGAAH